MNTRLRNIVLLLASTMTVMAGATIAPALPDMEASFSHLTNAALLVKLVLTLPAFMIAIVAPLVGVLLDYGHKKVVIMLSMLLYAIAGMSAYIFYESIYIILIGRVFLGIAVAGIMVTCSTLIGDYFTGQKVGQYMGLQAAFGGFGGVVFLAMGGVLADVYWRTPFLIYSLALGILPGLYLYINEPIRNTSVKVALLGVEHEPAQNNSRGFVSICYLMALFEILGLYMVPVHYPFYMASIGAVSNSQVGLAIALMLLVMATISIFYYSFLSWASFQMLQIIGLSLLGLGYILLGNISTYTESLLAMSIGGLGFGLMRPNLMAWLMSSTAPAQRGRIMGGIVSFFFMGQFLSPIATQPIIDATSYAKTFEIVAYSVILLALIFCARFAPWGRYHSLLRNVLR